VNCRAHPRRRGRLQPAMPSGGGSLMGSVPLPDPVVPAGATTAMRP
jgi:hypothetical protein